MELVAGMDSYATALQGELAAASVVLDSLRGELLTPAQSWTSCTLAEVAALSIGRTPSRGESRYWTDDLDHPFITIADMDGWLLDEGSEGVTEAAISEGKAKAVPAGGLVMSFKLTIGRVAIATKQVFTNEAIVWIQPDETVRRDYLAHWLASRDLTGGTVRAVKGATLNSKSLAAIEVAFPETERQREIEDLLESARIVVDRIKDEIGALADARAVLIEDLFSHRVALQSGSG